MNIQFLNDGACHAVASCHGTIPDSSVDEKVLLVKVMEVGSQQYPSELHSGPHSDAPDLVLLTHEKMMFWAVVFPHMIVTLGQDYHGTHYEEDWKLFS